MTSPAGFGAPSGAASSATAASSPAGVGSFSPMQALSEMFPGRDVDRLIQQREKFMRDIIQGNITDAAQIRQLQRDYAISDANLADLRDEMLATGGTIQRSKRPAPAPPSAPAPAPPSPTHSNASSPLPPPPRTPSPTPRSRPTVAQARQRARDRQQAPPPPSNAPRTGGLSPTSSARTRVNTTVRRRAQQRQQPSTTRTSTATTMNTTRTNRQGNAQVMNPSQMQRQLRNINANAQRIANDPNNTMDSVTETHTTTLVYRNRRRPVVTRNSTRIRNPLRARRGRGRPRHTSPVASTSTGRT